MKYSITIDSEREEEVIIYAHSRNATVERLEAILQEKACEIVGFRDDEIVRILPQDTSCFTVEDKRIYAVTEMGKYLVKLRLYQLEERLGDDFLRINQSCIVNVEKIESFKTSLGGSLMVTLKGGYRDYVSRRQLKTVKERIGF